MHLFPSIDLRGGQVVRLYQGEYDRQTTYGADPLTQAQAFAGAGASWLHVVDLDGARTGSMTHVGIIEQICSHTALNVQVGGGVRSEQTIEALLGSGVRRVVLGTAALTNWSWFEDLVRKPSYEHRLVLGLDARHGALAVQGWEQRIDATALEVARRVSDWPLAALVYTDIDTDGTLQGPDIRATGEIANATQRPVVASGGVGSLDHLRALALLPLEGVIVGRALYERTLTIEDALGVIEGQDRGE